MSLALHILFLTSEIASWGYVTPQLRALKVDVNEKKKLLFFWFYFDGEISDHEQRNAQHVCKSAMGRFFNSFKNETLITRCDFPKKIPTFGHYAFLRDETIFENGDTTQRPSSILPGNYFNDHLSAIHNFHLLTLYALLGRIRPNLRMLRGDIDEWRKELYFWFYYDGEIPQRAHDNANKVADEITRTCGVNYTAHKYIERLDYSQKIPSIGVLVYLRDEKNP